MTVTSTTIIQDIGEVYYNLGVENDTSTVRRAIVTSQISKADTEVSQVAGSSYDAVTRPLAAAYCCNAAKGGQGPNTLGNSDLQEKYENFMVEARAAALRRGFRLDGGAFSMRLAND